MTRKHFQAIANEFSRAMETTQNKGEDTAIELLAEGVADRLAEFNPAFDRDKFLAACGVADT